MEKKFISINPMKAELLELFKTALIEKEVFNTDRLTLEVSLKAILDKKLAELQLEQPKIFITADAYLKLRHLVENNTGEVAWHHLIEKHDNNYMIVDTLVFPQWVTSVTANGIDNNYEVWLATLPNEQFDLLKGHGHSHVNMAVNPSGVDENYYQNLMTQVEDYYITLITNKAGALHMRFYDKVNNIQYTDMPLTVCFADGTPIASWYDEYKDLIMERKITPAPIKTAKTVNTTPPKKNIDKVNEDYENYLARIREDDQIDPWGTKLLHLITPQDTEMSFVSEEKALDYIYNLYITKAPKIDKVKMKVSLQKHGCIAFDKRLNDFAYNINYLNSAELDYAIRQCEFWEVLPYELK